LKNSVTIDGTGSVWTTTLTNGSSLILGTFGTGEVLVENGGRLQSHAAVIGAEAGGNGFVTVNSPGSIWTDSGVLTVGSSLGNGTLTLQNGGAVSATTGISIGPHGTVRGSGTIVGNVTNAGTLAPGMSPGAIRIEGNYTQNAGSKLEIELASLGSYDKLGVSGDAALGGVLHVDLIDGYMPRAGDSFDILDCGRSIGTFTLVLPPLGGSLEWRTDDLYTTGVLTVVASGLLGDYNRNGVVDAADYVVWRSGLGTTYTENDYEVWRSHFGQTAGSGSAVSSGAPAATPEPTALTLAAAGALVFAARQRPTSGHTCRFASWETTK
jgi:T5SS/PEP-CTERM-associated repeat protein